MIVAGIDPSNKHTGIAFATPHPDLERRIVLAESVTMLTGDDGVIRSVVERIYPTLDLAPARTPIWIEEAPPTARGDVDHGPQGAIGFAQGWLGGLIAGRYVGQGWPVHRVGPSPWRAHMLVEAARAGFLMQEPHRGRAAPPDGPAQRWKVEPGPDRSFVKVWAQCDHRDTFANYQALSEGLATRCPTCAAGVAVPRGMSEADAIRDAWKQTACLFVARFYPDRWASLVIKARERAKMKQLDHHLAGVADACEAVGIALYGLAQRTP